MPNQEHTVDEFRTSPCTTHRKASFIENLRLPETNDKPDAARKYSHSGVAPTPVKEEVLYRAKSLQLSEYTFSDMHGNHKSAEVIRKVRANGVGKSVNPTDTMEIQTETPEGILSIAILKRHILCDCLILVKKYRPSLKAFVLEFPAKIVEPKDSSDGNESDSSVGDAAKKDLEDNTGYRSTQVKWVSPETAVDPELCDNKLKLVSLIIDGDDPIRNNLIPCYGSSDDESGNAHVCTNECMDELEVIPLPINGLLDRLNEYSRRKVVVDSRVYAFAIGLKKGERLAQNLVKPEKVELGV